MSDPSPFSRTRSPEAISPRAPEGWAWLAGVAILVMAAYGLFRGITGVQGGEASLLPTPHAGGIVAPVDAAPATPMTKDAQWSTLSGPQVVTPPPAPVKVVKAAPTDDSADDQSDNPPDKSSTDTTDNADQADAPPSPKVKPKPAKVAPAPVPDEDAPPAASPDGQ
jgi:hypothetical protein